ncbi:MAG: CoA synthetase [Gammaproteobacteria bacterium]|nr:CoA synthetase [Gammaproteobacteria bacterium]
MQCLPEELLIATIADLLLGCRTVAVGVSSPIPGSAALLARAQSSQPLRVELLESLHGNSFTRGSVELFDRAAQGRIDAFFLGGGQIDGLGNINLVGAGEYPAGSVRWPGSFGSSYLYFLVPRVILFREEHSRRVLVPRVDFVSAPGVSEPGVFRRGGPYALITSKAAFLFDAENCRFRLSSIHPGHTLEEVLDNTGFEFDYTAAPAETSSPSAATLATIRGSVAGEIAAAYPQFAARVFPRHQ